jgi:predicted metalloendopeptidase
LHPPFYAQDLPPEFNLGGLGTVIGHEFTHGFDNMGRKYDLNGSLRNWWTNKSIEQFEQRTRCMTEQYSKYQVFPDANVDGNLTLPENIADNGSLHIAYNALQKLYKDQNKSPDEPTKMSASKAIPAALTNLTPNQLFFLSFGQLECQKVPEGDQRHLLKYDTHSPGRYRVIGSLQNFSPFSKAFSCKIGSPMNPNKKCQVW